MSATTDQPARPAISPDDWRYYYYSPSKALAIATAAVFFAFFVAHVLLILKTRAKYASGEVLGYAFRRISADHPTGRKAGLLWYILQSLAIILSPALMAASLYMCFGRVISYVGERYSPVRASRVTFTFVTFDVISFIVQGAGGSLYSSDNRSIYPAAKAILIVGFLIQIIALGVFFTFAIICASRCLSIHYLIKTENFDINPTSDQIRARRAGESEGKWTVCLYTLYGDYGLETLPIVLCVLLFIFSHPGFYIPSDRSVKLHPEQIESSSTSDEEKDVGSLTKRKKFLKRIGWN
ncbi:hypothetical protein OIV83_005532 [Microbotryomycetes sp. JL201]|nr:hypothetical protein OIV83_005532 [Microbotryomycetes sp. JL201]